MPDIKRQVSARRYNLLERKCLLRKRVI